MIKIYLKLWFKRLGTGTFVYENHELLSSTPFGSHVKAMEEWCKDFSDLVYNKDYEFYKMDLVKVLEVEVECPNQI